MGRPAAGGTAPSLALSAASLFSCDSSRAGAAVWAWPPRSHIRDQQRIHSLSLLAPTMAQRPQAL